MIPPLCFAHVSEQVSGFLKDKISQNPLLILGFYTKCDNHLINPFCSLDQEFQQLNVKDFCLGKGFAFFASKLVHQ